MILQDLKHQNTFNKNDLDKKCHVDYSAANILYTSSYSLELSKDHLSLQYKKDQKKHKSQLQNLLSLKTRIKSQIEQILVKLKLFVHDTQHLYNIQKGYRYNIETKLSQVEVFLIDRYFIRQKLSKIKFHSLYSLPKTKLNSTHCGRNLHVTRHFSSEKPVLTTFDNLQINTPNFNMQANKKSDLSLTWKS